ncbi:hypothetical protein FSP39_011962 [Pinctada imbricata]|uniref:Calx-beta domain-containing protein n=1 Tax=Pinctada imbricata TaxID=66713 RepID=A0AA88Y6P3_PINIB|nr:hypothetical protein FSP39_011962 [Pinctada imbricata]
MSNNTTSTTLPTTTPFNIEDYVCREKGKLLPVINEYTWSPGTRAFLYLLFLLWSFMGVAIIADVFMCAIERITSKTAKVRVPDPDAPEGFRILRVKVWNDTVANLSLLALGTSAPEILLSVIEIVGAGFEAGELGPGTIVGSASFNLLVIGAICIYSIPDGEVRQIANLKVFAVTTFSCIFAYVWLTLVLLVITPGYVTLWEAIITFLMFPALIFVAYMADRDCCMKKVELEENGMVGISLNDKEERRPALTKQESSGEGTIMKLAKELGHESFDQGLPEEEAAKIAAAKIQEHQHHDRLWYRINATRGVSGGKKLIPRVLTTFQQLYDTVTLPEEERTENKLTVKKDHTEGGTKAVVEFTAASLSVLENEQKVRVGIRRYGKLDKPVKVKVETINGTAVAPEDYIHLEEVIEFAANEQLRQLYIQIVDDNEWEPDEFFFVKLALTHDEETNESVVLGPVSISQITIINDDEPGKLEFAKPSIIAKESGRHVRIPVNRIHGADGHVSVKWRTKDITAISGVDYEGGEGELKFDHGETTKNIDIHIHDTNKDERDESFEVELGETDGGAELAKIKKTIVTIVNDEEFNGLVSRIVNLTKANLDALQLEDSTWVSQFKTAMNVNGGDLETATFVDYILHFCTFFWKILFAFVPPPKYLGGWPAFILSLAVIGLMTALIGDAASIFGCLIGLKDSITAISIVALGTSMPDTFASKTAAVNEKTADSSIGNINGSNSVNVFLGLGLSWLIATIYHLVKTGSDFEVPAKTLAFSVVLYTVAAIVAIVLLVLRRTLPIFGNAELGGPKVPKIFCSIIFFSLWLFYLLMSILKAYDIITVNI